MNNSKWYAVIAGVDAAALSFPSHGTFDSVLNAFLAFGMVWFAIAAVRS